MLIKPKNQKIKKAVSAALVSIFLGCLLLGLGTIFASTSTDEAPHGCCPIQQTQPSEQSNHCGTTGDLGLKGLCVSEKVESTTSVSTVIEDFLLCSNCQKDNLPDDTTFVSSQQFGPPLIPRPSFCKTTFSAHAPPLS